MRLSTYPLIQFSQLIDCPVWDCHTGQLLGTVHQIWLDKQLHQVLGLTYKTLLNKDEQGSLPWEQVVAVSPERAWLDVSESTALIFQPKSSIHYQLGNEVWTHSGSRLGTLIDYYFEANTGEILQYQCVVSEHQKYFPELLDFSAAELIYKGDRFLIELTVDPRKSRQDRLPVTVGFATSPVESNMSLFLHNLHLDLNFDANQFNRADTSLRPKTTNLIAN
ncbi:hypothetical protein [Acaryochloris marina]|uniref:hypothetical protein n=1 Tax=Acaryochloris marina TaxID=155978 RepID=UPI001BAF27A9|nr:hypothetical protein [Acaryochloris marina]QUY45476.1 hypothetical protein I1H34_27265 [Acaryochloris marina S15]